MPVAFNCEAQADQLPSKYADTSIHSAVTCSQRPAVAYAIQAGALRTNPASGPDGVGVQADHAYTQEARSGSGGRHPHRADRQQWLGREYRWRGLHVGLGTAGGGDLHTRRRLWPVGWRSIAGRG